MDTFDMDGDAFAQLLISGLRTTQLGTNWHPRSPTWRGRHEPQPYWLKQFSLCPCIQNQPNEAMVAVVSRLLVVAGLITGGTAAKTEATVQATPISKVLDLMRDMLAKGDMAPPWGHEP